MTYFKELVSRTYFVDEVQWLRSEAGGTVYSKTIHTDTPFIIHFPQMPQFLFINKAIAIIYESFQLYTTYSALLCMLL